MWCYSFMNIKVLQLDFHPSNIWIREMDISCLEATQLKMQVDITQLLSTLSALTLATSLCLQFEEVGMFWCSFHVCWLLQTGSEYDLILNFSLVFILSLFSSLFYNSQCFTCSIVSPQMSQCGVVGHITATTGKQCWTWKDKKTNKGRTNNSVLPKMW